MRGRRAPLPDGEVELPDPAFGGHLIAAGPESLWAEVEAAAPIRDTRIRQAFLAVPRAPFVGGAEAAYGNEAIPIKRSGDEVLSSSTTPSLVAEMLDFLDVPPGSRILDVGTGSGFTAALLAVLTGVEGIVVSLDVEPDVVERASDVCRSLALPTLPVFLCQDAFVGAPSWGPFQRIVVTAGASFLPAAWAAQLDADGRILLPWKLRGLDLLVRLEPSSRARLRGSVLKPCAFPPLRASMLDPRHQWQIVDDVGPIHQRCPVREPISSFPTGRWPHLDFALYAALQTPAFHLFMGRRLQADGRWAALSLTWSEERFSLWTREHAWHTDVEARKAFHRWLEKWVEDGAPGHSDWAVTVDLEPAAPEPGTFRSFLLPGPQRLAFRLQGTSHTGRRDIFQRARP